MVTSTTQAARRRDSSLIAFLAGSIAQSESGQEEAEATERPQKKMMVVDVALPHRCRLSTPFPFSSARRRASSSDSLAPRTVWNCCRTSIWAPKLRLQDGTRLLPPPLESPRLRPVPAAAAAGIPSPPLDLTEENIRLVLADARAELAQIFDTSVGITGQVELAELDGPFVKISLKGRFWHERSMVLARVGNYLKQRIPEILEVDIEDEKQLDDSPENF